MPLFALKHSCWDMEACHRLPYGKHAVVCPQTQLLGHGSMPSLALREAYCCLPPNTVVETWKHAIACLTGSIPLFAPKHSCWDMEACHRLPYGKHAVVCPQTQLLGHGSMPSLALRGAYHCLPPNTVVETWMHTIACLTGSIPLFSPKHSG